jgi:alpha-tubulin suppressor-like RCC1 family protein
LCLAVIPLGNTIIHGNGGSFSTHFCVTGQVSGKTYCYGSNQPGIFGGGMLGDNSNIKKNIPTTVLVGNGVISSCVGGLQSCFLYQNGSVQCTGSGNYGVLGTGTINDSLKPFNVIGLLGSGKQLACGNSHVCILYSNEFDGVVQCWGRNNLGTLGIGSNITASFFPVNVTGFSNINVATWIAASYQNTCLISTAGGVFCTGHPYVTFENVSSTYSNTMVQVPGLLNGFETVSVGASHACALNMFGKVTCWGSATLGKLGNQINNANVYLPVNVTALPNNYIGIQVSTSTMLSCALLNTAQTWCFGKDGYGQMGQGNISGIHLVAVSVGPVGVVELGIGYTTICLVLADKHISCSGLGDEGQLGNSYFNNSLSFSNVSGLPDGSPTTLPTKSPTFPTTILPTRSPSKKPTSGQPSIVPTLLPTIQITGLPSNIPTISPYYN